MNKTAVYAILVAVILPLAGYFILKKATDSAVVMPRHYIYDSTTTRVEKGKEINDTFWHRIRDAKLTNQLGQQVSLADLGDRIIVADFFFTHCPTICPRLTTNMKLLQEHIHSSDRVGSRDAKFVQFISFSIDPERDSVAQLKKWADRFQIDPSNWWLLTGDKKTIYDLSLEHMKLAVVDGENVDTSFIHTDKFVLIDKNRNIRGYYSGLDTADIAKLSSDIILLSLEKDPKRKSFFAGKLELMVVVLLVAMLGFIGVFIFFKKERKVANVQYNKE